METNHQVPVERARQPSQGISAPGVQPLVLPEYQISTRSFAKVMTCILGLAVICAGYWGWSRFRVLDVAGILEPEETQIIRAPIAGTFIPAKKMFVFADKIQANEPLGRLVPVDGSERVEMATAALRQVQEISAVQEETTRKLFELIYAHIAHNLVLLEKRLEDSESLSTAADGKAKPGAPSPHHNEADVSQDAQDIHALIAARIEQMTRKTLVDSRTVLAGLLNGHAATNTLDDLKTFIGVLSLPDNDLVRRQAIDSLYELTKTKEEIKKQEKLLALAYEYRNGRELDSLYDAVFLNEEPLRSTYVNAGDEVAKLGNGACSLRIEVPVEYWNTLSPGTRMRIVFPREKACYCYLDKDTLSKRQVIERQIQLTRQRFVRLSMPFPNASNIPYGITAKVRLYL